MKRILVLFVAVAVLTAAAIWIRQLVRTTQCRPDTLTTIDDPADLDDLHLELPREESISWVNLYKPEMAESGFNLAFYRQRIPIIIDMNGRIVHSWPMVRGVGRVRLNPDGSLVAIGTDNLVKEYDWEGNLTWFYQLPDKHYFPHHDLIRLENGNYLILGQDGHSWTDFLFEVNRNKEVQWEWWFVDHQLDFPTWEEESDDPTHSNSVRELPPNRWFDGGDDRFRPGNILVSARNLNTVFIIDRQNGEVVWSYSKGLDRQHEATMAERGRHGAGMIIVFNNGLENLNAYRRSRVELIDPVAGEVVWDYASEFFFSKFGGTAQPLPGRTTLITSSQGGRAFEILPGGGVVWEWIPPYRPMRLERLPYDYCPELEALRPADETEVRRATKQPFIDAGLYQFDSLYDTDNRVIAGRDRAVLRSKNTCRELLIPRGAMLRAGFGIDEERLGGRSVDARFTLTIDDHEGPSQTLLDVSIDESSTKLWQTRRIPIESFFLKSVELCVATSAEGDMANPMDVVAWANPVVKSEWERNRRKVERRRVSAQEQKLREQHLKALGYVE